MTTAVTPASFRANFPEFSDVAVYPEGQIQFWINYGDMLLSNLCRWGTMRDMGIQLLVAHEVALAARNKAAADAGGTPGSVQGAVSSKSVGGVSVGYDTSAAVLENGGHWNLTSYGVQFWQLVLIVGTGGFQL